MHFDSVKFLWDSRRPRTGAAVVRPTAGSESLSCQVLLAAGVLLLRLACLLLLKASRYLCWCCLFKQSVDFSVCLLCALRAELSSGPWSALTPEQQAAALQLGLCGEQW